MPCSSISFCISMGGGWLGIQRASHPRFHYKPMPEKCKRELAAPFAFLDGTAAPQKDDYADRTISSSGENRPLSPDAASTRLSAVSDRIRKLFSTEYRGLVSEIIWTNKGVMSSR